MKVSDDIVVYCPEVIEYSPEFQAQLADALEKLPEDLTPIETALIDYHETREDLRDCENNS